MLQRTAAPVSRRPPLYRRIRYEIGTEAAAFERLAQLDIPGCRKAFGRLLTRLDLAPGRADGRQVVQLLADLLHQVNRRIYRGPEDDTTYQANRVMLIEQFSSCDLAEAARERFMASLNRLLAPVANNRTLHPLVERARTYIEENYHQRIFLSSVATTLHISPNYLSRLFRRETGVTLTSYIQQRRMEHAMLLLGEGGRSISEIAYQVGYQNYRDFYRNFVKYANASPRQVRQRLAQEAAGRRAAAAAS